MTLTKMNKNEHEGSVSPIHENIDLKKDRNLETSEKRSEKEMI